MSKIVAGLFSSYINAVYPEPLDRIQFQEIERAFYAGSKSTIDIIQQVADVSSDEPTDGDLAFMDRMYGELERFVSNVGKVRPKPQPRAENANDPKPTLGDMPVDEKYRTMMNAIAMTLDEFLNPEASGTLDRTTGFVLLVFPFGDEEGRANYISNGADRSQVAQLLEQQAKRFREPGHG